MRGRRLRFKLVTRSLDTMICFVTYFRAPGKKVPTPRPWARILLFDDARHGKLSAAYLVSDTGRPDTLGLGLMTACH